MMKNIRVTSHSILDDGWQTGLPTETGVYERDLLGESSKCYSRWTGRFWCIAYFEVELARNTKVKSTWQDSANTPWRKIKGETYV